MKRLSFALLILSAFLFATPAVAQTTRVLLKATHINQTITNIYPYCMPFDTDFYVPNYCGWQYANWIVARNATITEIEVLVLENTGDMAGDCSIQLWTDDGTDNYFIRFPGDTDHYFNLSGSQGQVSGTGGPAGYSRQAYDLDVTRGMAIGVALNDWTPIPGNCMSEENDPVTQVYIWGEYTD